MNILFYIASLIAILSTVMVITRVKPVHALLYLVVSFLALAVVFYTLGAPYIAALEIIIYAGAIVVLFLFVVMLLNAGAQTAQQEREWLQPSMWIGPSILALILLLELIYMLVWIEPGPLRPLPITPKMLSIEMFTTYLLGVELASFLLMAGLVGAYHLGREETETGRAPEET